MGRRHLSLLAAVAAVAFVVAAPAAGMIRFAELARGTAGGEQAPYTVAYVALDRPSVSRWAERVPQPAETRARRVDFRKRIVVAVFGKFGCHDYRIAVSSVVRRGARLVVRFTRKPLAPKVVECLSIFPTYRLLAVEKADLGRPYPTRAEATVAGA